MIAEQKTANRATAVAERKNIIPLTEPAGGICITCIYKNSCLYSRTESVLSCEEFSTGTIFPEKNTQAVKTGNSNTPVKHGKIYQGLCVNCEDRENCSLSGKRGGIWHCGEYS